MWSCELPSFGTGQKLKKIFSLPHIKKTTYGVCYFISSLVLNKVMVLMDAFQLKTTLISSILALLVGSLIYHIIKKKTQHVRNNNTKICTAPQAAGAWPFIGHMHLFLDHQKLTHKTLGLVADKHGPIFTITLGSYKVLVLSSCDMAKECFTLHDKAFSTRPCVASSKLMGYNYAMFWLHSLWSLLAWDEEVGYNWASVKPPPWTSQEYKSMS